LLPQLLRQDIVAGRDISRQFQDGQSSVSRQRKKQLQCVSNHVDPGTLGCVPWRPTHAAQGCRDQARLYYGGKLSLLGHIHAFGLRHRPARGASDQNVRQMGCVRGLTGVALEPSPDLACPASDGSQGSLPAFRLRRKHWSGINQPGSAAFVLSRSHSPYLICFSPNLP